MRFRARIVLVGLILFGISVLLLGERRIPTGPDGGWALDPPPRETSPPTELQVATFNIHGCKGTDGLRDVGRIADQLGDIDLVGLNEVHGDLWSAPQDQVAHLANLWDEAESNWVFAPAETQWFGMKRFGNGLLTRRPILGWQRIPLPRRDDHSCRNMLVAHIDGALGMVSVLVTHVTRSNDHDREIQLETVLNLFAALDPPAILLADLNTAPGDARMDRFLAESDAIDAIKAGGVLGSDRVDWILVRGLECLGASRVDTEASDHPLFRVRLKGR